MKTDAIQEAPANKLGKVKTADVNRMAEQAITTCEETLNALEDKRLLTVGKVNEDFAGQKKKAILDTVKYLKAIMKKEDWKTIASKMWRQLKELDHISKSWFYEIMPADCIDQERAVEIAEGRRVGAGTVSVPVGTHSGGSGEGSSGALPQGTFGSRMPNNDLTMDSFMPALDAVIDAAIPDGDHYRIPRAPFDKLVRASGRVVS